MKIAVSYLKSKEDLESTIKGIDASSADYIHVDLMDGVFVENKNDDLSMHVNALKNASKKLDVHLMMQGQALLRGIETMSLLNPEYITIHSEIEDVEKYIEQIKKKNIKVGLAINPGTPIDSILSYLDQVDLILIMSVYPGRGGQEFIRDTEHKLNKLNHIRKIIYLNYKIEVDGGINDKTINNVSDADIAVSGNYITSSSDYQKQVSILKGDITC